MQNKNPIIIIAVLSVLALGLGYWVGLPKEGSGGEGKNGGGKKEPDFLKKGLVAYYPFNGNAKDESGNENHGEVTGATFVDGRHGVVRRACYFDGSSDYIEIEHSESVSFSSSNYAITMWVKYPSQAENGWGYSALFIKARGTEPFYGPTVFASHKQKGKVDFREVGNAELMTNKSKLDDNIWRHFVFMKRGVRYSIFINGILDSSVERDFGDVRINDRPIVLGANQTVRTGQNYKGYMDDLRIYNRALSEAEVKALYEFEKVK